MSKRKPKQTQQSKTSCATCLLRWFGVVEGHGAKWFCRKDLKLKRNQLPLIGDDEDLKNAKGCKEWVE